MSFSWRFLGKGGCNFVYVNDEKNKVLKIRTDRASLIDEPKRSVRLWNEINSHLEEPAQLDLLGWTCPYIEGKQASDEEISKALIEICAKTQRIVIDGPQDGNFIKRKQDGMVICVDIAAAYLLEERPDRRNSIVSLSAYRQTTYPIIAFLKEKYSIRPLSVDTVRALIFIKKYYTDLEVSFLKGNNNLIQKIAAALIHEGENAMLDFLNSAKEKEEIPVLLEVLKLLDIKNQNTEILNQCIVDSKSTDVEVLKKRVTKLYNISEIHKNITSVIEILEKCVEDKKDVSSDEKKSSETSSIVTTKVSDQRDPLSMSESESPKKELYSKDNPNFLFTAPESSSEGAEKIKTKLTIS